MANLVHVVLIGLAGITIAASAQEPLGPWRMTIGSAVPTHFVLSYTGKNRQIRGLLCYSFAGYNEVCVNPKSRWLTPASQFQLPAPGGVPREFLLNYVAIVRFPDVDDRVYKVAVSDVAFLQDGSLRSRNNTRD